MAPFGFRRKKEKEEKKAEKKETVTRQPVQKPQKSLLEELCGDDRELYEALTRTILLNPELTMKEGVDSYAGKAQEYEKAGKYVAARIAYQAAGELSLYEGKPAQIQKFFKKATEADPNFVNRKVFEYLTRKENAERASAVAQEFYSKWGKHTETKEGSSE